MAQKRDYLAQSFQQPGLCYLCLKTHLSSTHSSAGCSSLGTENSTLSGLLPGVRSMDLWSLFLPSSPHLKWSAFSSRAVLQTEHRTAAEHSPVWGLLPAGCGPIHSPILCFPFFSFYCATAQHCQFILNQRSTVTSSLSWRAAVPLAVPQPVLVSKAARIQLSESPGSTHHHCNLCAPKEPRVPLQCGLTKGTKLCV